MPTKSVTKYFVLLLVFALTGCIERFEPQVKDVPKSFLVVDGSINARGVSSIRLTRSVSLGEKGSIPAETKATMYIEEETGLRYPLTETAPGTYTSAALTLPAGRRVRLHFTTAARREYASAYTPVKLTPPIDAVTWEVVRGGVQVAVDAHDDTQQSRYYRWGYEETWEFTSAFFSQVEYSNANIVSRFTNIYRCWQTQKSTAIKLGTTTRLAQDVVSQQPLTLLPSDDTKLRIKYSILVRQYAQTAEEYAYWETLRKNTENIGTLFDPLPSQLTGNVQCVSDAAEVVLGFVGAQSMTEKRIFIATSQLPADWRYRTGYESCNFLDTIPRPHADGRKPTPKEVIDYFSSGYFVPVEELATPGGRAFLFSSADCVDCRKRGTNVRPSFWQ